MGRYARQEAWGRWNGGVQLCEKRGWNCGREARQAVVGWCFAGDSRGASVELARRQQAMARVRLESAKRGCREGPQSRRARPGICIYSILSTVAAVHRLAVARSSYLTLSIPKTDFCVQTLHLDTQTFASPFVCFDNNSTCNINRICYHCALTPQCLPSSQ